MRISQRSYKKLNKKQLQDLLVFVENLKSQWMSTVDALVDPLIMIDLNYNIQKANLAMAQWAGKDIKEIIGKKCYEVFAGRSSPCVGCKMKKAALNHKTQQYTLENLKGSRYFEVTSQPILNSNTKKIEGIVQIYRDRTEAKRLEEQLIQSEKLASIGLLAGGVAHELNNPLGGILMFAEVVLKEILKRPDLKYLADDVREIINATKRCKSIVENLLQFARKQPDSFPQNLVNINDALITALRFGRVGFKNNKIVQVKEELSSKNLSLFFDRNKLIQVFLNLIQNAYQAMPDGGTLTVKTYDVYDENKKRYAVCEISDTGIGIPKDHLNKIFDPFFTTKEPGEGTGLGLSIAYSLVRQMNGTIEVKSVVNKGSTFIVKVPILKRYQH